MTEKKEETYFLIGFGINGYPRLKKLFSDPEDAAKYILTLKRKTWRSPRYEEKMLSSPNFFLHETAAAFHILKVDVDSYPRYKSILNEQEPLYAIDEEQKQESDRSECHDGNEFWQNKTSECRHSFGCC